MNNRIIFRMIIVKNFGIPIKFTCDARGNSYKGYGFRIPVNDHGIIRDIVIDHILVGVHPSVSAGTATTRHRPARWDVDINRGNKIRDEGRVGFNERISIYFRLAGKTDVRRQGDINIGPSRAAYKPANRQNRKPAPGYFFPGMNSHLASIPHTLPANTLPPAIGF